MAEDTKEGDSDIDLYCDLEEIGNGHKANEESLNVDSISVPDISKLFSENECKVFFSEDGKKTKIRIKKPADCNEAAANGQSPVEDLDLFTDVVTEKFVRAEQEKLERKTLISQNVELKKLNSQLEAEINTLMKKNHTLMKNICALYKTAKEEISRKDALIAELREENDNMIFRRTRLLGDGSGPVRRPSKFQGSDSVGAANACHLNGKSSELKTNGHGVPSAFEECSSRNPEQRHLSGNSERRKKLPKAFQDPKKQSHRRHSSHNSHRKRKKSQMTSKDTYSDSEGSLESHFSHSRLSGNSSESDANHLFQETLRETKKFRPAKKKHRKSVLSSEELRCIYSDYQRRLDDPKSRGENREEEKSNFSTYKSGNFNKANMNCDSEDAVEARNNLFKKLLSYERQDSLQEPERKQKHIELKRIISSASDVEDFTQLYSKYLAQWALSSIHPPSDTDSSRETSCVDDSDEHLAYDVENESDYPGEYDLEEDYDENYEHYSGSKYVDLDKPHDNFYGAPPKSFYDHLMEEKARQVHMYSAKDYQTSSCAMDSSKTAKQCDREQVLSATQLPEALRGDSLKLYSYQGKPVPVAVKKKVLGYAKSPKKAAVGKGDSDISTSKLKKAQRSEKPS